MAPFRSPAPKTTTSPTSAPTSTRVGSIVASGPERLSFGPDPGLGADFDPLAHVSDRAATRDALRQLRAKLDDAGCFAPADGRSLALFLVTATVALVAAVALFFAWSRDDHAIAAGLLPVLVGAVWTPTMIGHESSHGAIANRWLRAGMTWLSQPVIAGLSAGYWKHKHNRVHHGHPNVVGVDTDLHHPPLVIGAELHRRSTRPEQWFQRHLQGWLFWPSTLGLSTFFRVRGWLYLARHFRERGADRAFVVDVGGLVLHHALWLAWPASVVGLGPALVVYATVWAGVGVLLAVAFLPGHTGLPLVSSTDDGWRLQLETTRNCPAPRWLSPFLVGTDWQLCHHLFPRTPFWHLPRAGSITEAFLRERGLPVHHTSFWPALVESTRYLRRAHEDEAFALRDGLLVDDDNDDEPGGALRARAARVSR